MPKFISLSSFYNLFYKSFYNLFFIILITYFNIYCISKNEISITENNVVLKSNLIKKTEIIPQNFYYPDSELIYEASFSEDPFLRNDEAVLIFKISKEKILDKFNTELNNNTLSSEESKNLINKILDKEKVKILDKVNIDLSNENLSSEESQNIINKILLKEIETYFLKQINLYKWKIIQSEEKTNKNDISKLIITEIERRKLVTFIFRIEKNTKLIFIKIYLRNAVIN